jgi:subtilisin family serine protease
MDVGFRSVGTVLLLLFSLSACSEKTTTAVFDETALGSASCQGRAKSNSYIVQWEDGHFTVETASSVEKFKEDFLKPNLDKIRKVEYDRIVHFERDADVVRVADIDPADNWGQDMVEVASLWNEGVYGQNVTVGVIDSPVDITQPQLAPRIAFNTAEIPNNGIDDDNNGFIDDYAGFSFISEPSNDGTVSEHGTHVSGIIGADHSKGYIKGMAPQVKIVPAPFYRRKKWRLDW